MGDEAFLNGRYGYFTLNENNELELHGFSNMKADDEVHVRFQDEKLFIIVPQDGDDFETKNTTSYKFDGSAQCNKHLIDILNMTGSLNCLFVWMMGMYMQLPGAKID